MWWSSNEINYSAIIDVIFINGIFMDIIGEINVQRWSSYLYTSGTRTAWARDILLRGVALRQINEIGFILNCAFLYSVEWWTLTCNIFLLKMIKKNHMTFFLNLKILKEKFWQLPGWIRHGVLRVTYCINNT